MLYDTLTLSDIELAKTPPLSYAALGGVYWYVEGSCRYALFHNLEGPAVIISGNLYWYFLGYQLDVEEWAENVLRLKSLPADKSSVDRHIRSILQDHISQIL